MTASALLDAKTVADAFDVAPIGVRSGQRRRSWWRRMSLLHTNKPTTFQKCLALHMFAAERVGVLD